MAHIKIWFNFILYTLIVIDHFLLVTIAIQIKVQGGQDALSVISCALAFSRKSCKSCLDFPELILFERQLEYHLP